MKVKIFYSILFVFFLGGIAFCLLPYNFQCSVGLWALEVGEDIDKDYGDVILVPGAGCNPGRGTEERLNLASSLYKIKPRKVIISEGYCFPKDRQYFMSRIHSRWHIDTNDVIWDTLSFNTEENILHMSQKGSQLGLNSAILCTSPHHQLRCRMLLNKFWVGDYQIAKMPDSLLECNKEQVYVNKLGHEILHEYLKTAYEFLF